MNYRPTPRLVRLLSAFYQLPEEKPQRLIQQLRLRRDTWPRDWEGESKRARTIIRVAFKHRHAA